MIHLDFLNKMIDSLFAGSSTNLVLQALGNHKASNEELEKIRGVEGKEERVKYLEELLAAWT